MTGKAEVVSCVIPTPDELAGMTDSLTRRRLVDRDR
jgi:hypothetical protein